MRDGGNRRGNQCLCVRRKYRLAGATIAPPLSRSKETDHRRTGGDRDVGWTGVSADIDLGPFRERIKSLQRKANGARFA